MTPENLETVPPPWTLRGDAFAFCHRTLDGRLCIRAWVCYTQSPVGSYNEMATATWTKHGPSVVEMPVTLQASMRGGRENWGYPKSLETIEWTRDANRVLVGARGEIVRARISRFSLPIFVRAWTAQKLNGAWIRAPFEIEGRAHFAFAGRRLGVFVEDFRMMVFQPEELK